MAKAHFLPQALSMWEISTKSKSDEDIGLFNQPLAVASPQDSIETLGIAMCTPNNPDQRPKLVLKKSKVFESTVSI